MLQDQRSFSEAWDYGGGKIIFFILLLCFWSPYLTHLNLHSHATSHYSPLHSGVSFQEGLGVEGGLRFANVEKQQTAWMQPWAAGLERALKRLQGQWMWELLLLSPGSDGNSDQIKDGSWVIRPLRSHLFITAEGEYHIYSRSIMEGTVMKPDVCHQQVWMTCHHSSYYPSEYNLYKPRIHLCVFILQDHHTTVCVWGWFKLQSHFFYFGNQDHRRCSSLTFNYREPCLICMPQSV